MSASGAGRLGWGAAIASEAGARVDPNGDEQSKQRKQAGPADGIDIGARAHTKYFDRFADAPAKALVRTLLAARLPLPARNVLE